MYVVSSNDDLWIPEVFDNLPQAADSVNAYLMKEYPGREVRHRVFMEYDENDVAIDLAIEFCMSNGNESLNYVISPAIVNRRYNAED